MSIADIIIEKIKAGGPMSFHDFMELALYHPGSGYYNSPGEKIGMRGDFYTSPYLTPIFGQMVAKQLEEMWRHLNREPFTIVEYGAGTGILCRDILDYLKSNKTLYDDLRYCIIEKSDYLLARQRKYLDEKVEWVNSIKEISPVVGCILTNEVLDNFAIHQVVMMDELMEVFVDYEGEFIEVLHPASPELYEYFDQMKIKLPKGHQAEINLQAKYWIDDVALALQKGFVMTMDYGYTSLELCTEGKRSGTLMCYYKHSLNDNPYHHIGEQDITSHVNFSFLRQHGSESGLAFGGFTDQAAFLAGIGIVECIRNIERKEEKLNPHKIFLIRKLLLDLGKKIKILLQYKGMKNPALSGFQFAIIPQC